LPLTNPGSAVTTAVAQSRRRRHHATMSETKAHARSSVAVRRWTDIDLSASLLEQLDTIFFEASNTKTFSSEVARAAFRERWFGRYLSQYPQWAYVAQTADGQVAGYLVGALDEATGVDDFAGAALEYPAHLHVNLAPGFRNRGIGRNLIDAFAADAARAGAKGMHVVTSADARNVRFYTRAGFSERARTPLKSGDLVFLGRSL
jgi:ribosomal protein S18 acetylase RimI-like enzyme